LVPGGVEKSEVLILVTTPARARGLRTQKIRVPTHDMTVVDGGIKTAKFTCTLRTSMHEPSPS